MNVRKTQGYTLAELMVVLAIIGFLVLIAVASFTVAISRAQAATCAANRVTLDRAIEVYFADTGAYPTGINDLQGYVSNWGSASKCPTGPSLTYVGATHSVACPVHSP